MTWACTSCGACCRSLGSGLLDLSPEVAALDSGDGVCRHLDRSKNLCTIYESRPAGCRVTSAHAPEALRAGCSVVHLSVYGHPWPPSERRGK